MDPIIVPCFDVDSLQWTYLNNWTRNPVDFIINWNIKHWIYSWTIRNILAIYKSNAKFVFIWIKISQHYWNHLNKLHFWVLAYNVRYFTFKWTIVNPNLQLIQWHWLMENLWGQFVLPGIVPQRKRNNVLSVKIVIMA